MTTTGFRTAASTAATIATGLLAGSFYVFACGVMPGLARSSDTVFVEVMSDINEAIQNPVFMLSFLGAPVLTAIAAWQLRSAPGRRWMWAALVANVLALLVTATLNIPLNETLGDARPPSEIREEFEDPWVAWNVVRTVLSTVALGCLAWAATARRRG
ncbi:anthrone oxygenase family protein [Streptomyces davaonensis]|nr:anthrone oxygenase family protein [Streptomyces davaonensis]